MTISIGRSFSLTGIDARSVSVEVDIRRGLPSYTTVGLGDKAVKESKNRINAAIKNSGYEFPVKRITVNLAPASVKKEGSAFDFPIALGILQACGIIASGRLDDVASVGELSLDGNLRRVRGVLPMARCLKEAGLKKILLPTGNRREAAVVEGIDVIPVDNLKKAVDCLNGDCIIDPFKLNLEEEFQHSCGYREDFADIKGQYMAKRAMEIAAAGGHNILMAGPPGAGKTMLARRILTILPSLSIEEAIQVTVIQSVAGAVPSGSALVSKRPLRSPHHTVSDIALVGGGSIPRPGEISLAHRGVLFLDEFPEFKRQAIEVIRQPMEDGTITVSRAADSATYPASFMLIAAMNPCPCGYFAVSGRDCTCTAAEIKKYRSKISGPVMDRIDMHICVPALRKKDMDSLDRGESSAIIRKRVVEARNIQRERYCEEENIFSNAEVDGKVVDRYCRPSEPAAAMLIESMEKYGLSVRGYNKTVKVARTIADLEGSEKVTEQHAGEALQYRIGDRQWEI